MRRQETRRRFFWRTHSGLEGGSSRFALRAFCGGVDLLRSLDDLIPLCCVVRELRCLPKLYSRRRVECSVSSRAHKAAAIFKAR